jgi:hypothetical protein
MVCSRWYSSICLEGLRKTMKTAVMIAGVAVRIQIKHLLNTSLDCYHCVSLLVYSCLLLRRSQNEIFL